MSSEVSVLKVAVRVSSKTMGNISLLKTATYRVASSLYSYSWYFHFTGMREWPFCILYFYLSKTCRSMAAKRRWSGQSCQQHHLKTLERSTGFGMFPCIIAAGWISCPYWRSSGVIYTVRTSHLVGSPVRTWFVSRHTLESGRSWEGTVLYCVCAENPIHGTDLNDCQKLVSVMKLWLN